MGELERTRHIHFVGIGGIGLSALAQIVSGRGMTVSGSDAAGSATIEQLERSGITVMVGHRAENIKDADMVVVTSAAADDNPEVSAARKRGIPVVRRQVFLRELSYDRRTVAIAGSHGKTTTTAMVGLILEEAGLDPEVVVGGIVPEWGTNARVGKGPFLVIEADEYDNAFLGLDPEVTVLTNVDYDHPDLFPTIESYREAYARFLDQTRNEGCVVVCGDDAPAAELARRSGKRLVTYGVSAGNAWRILEITQNELGISDVNVRPEKGAVASFRLGIPGRQNAVNAVGAMVGAIQAGASLDAARRALEKFRGVARRFEKMGTYQGAIIIDDYAHHPTEIKATLDAVRMRYPGATVWALFQPHTYSRTRALRDEFAEAFDAAEHALITEIYAAREQDDLGLSSVEIVKRMKHKDARFIPSLLEAEELLRTELKEGDVLVTLGAGNVNQVAKHLVQNSNA